MKMVRRAGGAHGDAGSEQQMAMATARLQVVVWGPGEMAGADAEEPRSRWRWRDGDALDMWGGSKRRVRGRGRDV